MPEDLYTTDIYVTGRFAQWAGDVEHAMHCFKLVAPGREYGSMPDTVHGPVELIRYCAAFRRRQIAQRKGAFEKVAKHYSRDELELSYEPILLTSVHTRATIWHVGPRQLQMRMYPLSRESADITLDRISATITQAQGVHESGSKGGLWIADTDPFVSCVANDSCLIQADALWTKRGDVDVLGLKDRLQHVFTTLNSTQVVTRR